MREPLADRAAVPGRVRIAARPLRRADPERSEEARDDRQPGVRHRVLHVAAGAEEEDDRADHRGRGQHRILERAERKDARDRLAAAQPRAAERPVVDREPAGGVRRGEDAEACDDRAHRKPEREQRAVVDAGDVAHREHVAQIGNNLAAEADGEPRRHDVLHRVVERAVAGHVGEPHRRGKGERSRDQQDQEVVALELERSDAERTCRCSHVRSPPQPLSTPYPG